MSLKSAMVIYRVDGVSGLNVLTGIMTKVLSATFEVGRPSFLSLAGNQLSVCKHAVLSPFGRRGARRLSKMRMKAISFLIFFQGPYPGHEIHKITDIIG